MSYEFKDDIKNHKAEKPKNKIIYHLTTLIKQNNDYDKAIKLIVDNNLKLKDIVSTTSRLTKTQVIKLANMLISLK